MMGGSFAERPMFEVLGTRVDAITMPEAIQRTRALIVRKKHGYIVFCTASSVLSAREQPEVATALRQASIVAPDGMPLVWIGKKADVCPIERVYGPDFLISFIETTGPRFRHYFYGGGPGTAETLVSQLRERFADLQVAGWHTPPEKLDPEDPQQCDLDSINESGADIVWVGLGHPKQELWMRANRTLLEAPILAGVGAAFDFHSGNKKEAPRWMKESGLQWLHRLSSEPTRLWRRYLIGNSKFLFLLARDWRRCRGRL